MDKVASLIPRNRTSQRRKPFEKKREREKFTTAPVLLLDVIPPIV